MLWFGLAFLLIIVAIRCAFDLDIIEGFIFLCFSCLSLNNGLIAISKNNFEAGKIYVSKTNSSQKIELIEISKRSVAYKFVNDSKETSDTLILPARELAKDIAYNYKQINVEEDERLL